VTAVALATTTVNLAHVSNSSSSIEKQLCSLSAHRVYENGFYI